MNKVVFGGLLFTSALAAYAAQVSGDQRAELVIVDNDGREKRARIADDEHEWTRRASESLYMRHFLRLKIAGAGNDFYVGLNDMDGRNGEAIDAPEARCLQQALEEGFVSEVRVQKRATMQIYRSLGWLNPFRGRGSYISGLEITFKDGSKYSPREAHEVFDLTAGAENPIPYTEIPRNMCNLLIEKRDARVDAEFEAQSEASDGTH